MENRQIKFRQPICNRNGDFVEWHYWGDIDGQWIETAILMNGVDTRRKSQRFTGINSKDGADIYAGDIIKVTCLYGFHGELLDEWKELHNLDTINGIGSLFTGIVVVDVQRGLMIKRLDNDYMEPIFSRHINNRSYLDLSTCEIIGNIYENPDLLKTDNK